MLFLLQSPCLVCCFIGACAIVLIFLSDCRSPSGCSDLLISQPERSLGRSTVILHAVLQICQPRIHPVGCLPCSATYAIDSMPAPVFAPMPMSMSPSVSPSTSPSISVFLFTVYRPGSHHLAIYLYLTWLPKYKYQVWYLQLGHGARKAEIVSLYVHRSLYRRNEFYYHLVQLLRVPVLSRGSSHTTFDLLVPLRKIFRHPCQFNFWQKLSSLFNNPVSQSSHCGSCRQTSLSGGGRVPAQCILKEAVLRPFCLSGYNLTGNGDSDLKFIQYVHHKDLGDICSQEPSIVPFNVPLHYFSEWLTRDELRAMATLHNVKSSARDRKPALLALFLNHQCSICMEYVTLFQYVDVVGARRKCNREKVRKCRQKMKEELQKSIFPPKPPTPAQIEQIVNDFCTDTSPASFKETGCAVCGQLKAFVEMTPISKTDCDLALLCRPEVSRLERKCSSDPIMGLQGPIIDQSCHHVCSTCLLSLRKAKIPKHALANGLWLGHVPDELKGLTFSERMMIARVRHNRCVVRVSSGRVKMTANVIMFSNPTLKVYQALPPSRDEMEEVLAFIFTGSAQPTEQDFARTPFLVRREKVSRALEWLKLNHADYKDLEISRANLESYPLSGVPVKVGYRPTAPEDSNRPPAATSMHDNEEEEGAEDGTCPFTVHGLSGSEFSKLSMTALKARALKHLEDGGGTLGIGHDDKQQSMYDNPQAYPQMFPWLFPYGYGGIGQECLKRKLSETEHKKCLLMYHDKRFQTDLYFPIVAFNHEQIKAGVTGSFLLAKRHKFGEISNRLTSLNRQVLASLMERLSNGEPVRPETDEERACFDVLDDLDHVGGHVKGSLTTKKYMRNEIWSLISFLGAPSWFITLSPADNRHPICIYFADTGERFSPMLRSSDERNRLVASNPVAAAHFFDLIVRSFIKNVLGVKHNHPGLYGETSGYYGTVEQQGRLTLHLHLLLWIDGALSPQEIRDRLMADDSSFQKDLIEYLEGVHKGEFLTGKNG